ncbi:MAG: GxxExxY protein [Bacteroidota bacterium]
MRADVFVEESIICELKAVDQVNPVWEAQILSHLRLTKKRLGFLTRQTRPTTSFGRAAWRAGQFQCPPYQKRYQKDYSVNTSCLCAFVAHRSRFSNEIWWKGIYAAVLQEAVRVEARARYSSPFATRARDERACRTAAKSE